MAPVRTHLFPLLALTTLALAACGAPAPAPVTPTPPAPPPGPQPYTRSVNVLNWIGRPVQGTTPQSAQQDAPITLDIAASGAGTLTFGVPSPVPAKSKTLSTALRDVLGCTNATGLTVTNDQSAYAQLNFLTILSASGGSDGSLALANDKVRLGGTNNFVVEEGGRTAGFYFVSAAATVKGTLSCGPENARFPADFDVSLQPGWNVVTFGVASGRFAVKSDGEAGLAWRILPAATAQPLSAGPVLRLSGVDVLAR